MQDELKQLPGSAEEQAAPELVAFHQAAEPQVALVPAPRWRDWINEMDDRWANRCLPLIVANEAGWVLLNRKSFEAVWTGEPGPSSVTIRYDDPDLPSPKPAESHFGYGIVTWGVPYLFRTPPGYNLLVRGPANWPKDGACALEGLVETDWSVATFTMNWKLTRPHHAVRFEAEEPFCMVLPQRRGELEAFRPSFRHLDSDPPTRDATKAWVESRHDAQIRKFLAGYSREYESDRSSWERDYFKGTAPDGTTAPTHQTHLKLSEFERER